MKFNYNEIGRILVRCLQLAARWSVWKWLLTSSIGALSSTLQFGEKIFHWSYERSLIFGISVFVILYFIRFLLIFAKESLKYFHEVYKNSIYGDAIILLKDSFAATHHYRKTPGHDDTEFIKSMMVICNNLKIIFDNVTKSNCCVSIKVPVVENKVNAGTVLINLTRDLKNSHRNTEEYSKIKHTLIGNSAFSTTFNKVVKNQKEKFYINNSINKTKNYDNTSKECYADGILPYNSELVFPIIPVLKETSNNFDCHGFICVDSDKENAFSGKYDVAILEGIADGVYDIISERNHSKNTINGQN